MPVTKKSSKKPNMGRPPKAITQKRGMQAAEILAAVNEVALWKECLECDDVRVKLDALKYLTDRRDGKAKQVNEITGRNGEPFGINVTFVAPNAQC
jgi:hypothetical protein